jgi:3-oxoacyl-[acyl-carrier protein] reductase
VSAESAARTNHVDRAGPTPILRAVTRLRYNSPYVAAKHGVIGLTRALAVELGPAGVTVNAVCPGPIRTGMTAGIPDEAKEKFARRKVPLRRYGEPEEVAHATLSLCLPASSYMSGAVLVVDGGMTAKDD